MTRFVPLSKTYSKVRLVAWGKANSFLFRSNLLMIIHYSFIYFSGASEIETRSVTEPAGALALAGLKKYILDNQLIGSGKKFVVVISGANMNFDRLRFVAERAELGEGREALLSVDIPERPGRCCHAFSSCHRA